MTRPDFLRGYLLLTTQPWGKAYRTVAVAEGEPNPAEIQLEFYYQALEKYEASSWVKTCEIHATGDHWPSIDALKLTLKQQIPKRQSLSAPSADYCTKDEFGLNLYETIKTNGGILGIDQQRAAAIHYEHPEKLTDLDARRKALQHALAQQLPTLNDEEMKQILEKYPWVVAA